MLPAARQSPPAVPRLTPAALRGLYAWLDRLPLSRPKRHLARDFSDGVRLAEIVKHFRPQLVDLHNYVPSCNTDQKLSNWSTLNRKVFHKLRFCVSEADIRKVVANTPGAVEPILCTLRAKVEEDVLGGNPLSEVDPRPYGLGAESPRAELTGRRHTAGISTEEEQGPASPPAPPCAWKPSARQRSLEEKGCACQGRDTAAQPWEPLDPGAQQLLEDKEQALAILQETVKRVLSGEATF
ncbi:sperm flagellar protein 1-like [Orycteropus afer afer]|uniref:Sperm flagellar protein 1-like n=1 Tax=Orycteropus afer afer TaxID=1230840 RepID=A0A8B6ZM21_ORYAF|nr:sperm flagellar protein 1-like [Orycteropus afer afer]